jgi:hypothetical protein
LRFCTKLEIALTGAKPWSIARGGLRKRLALQRLSANFASKTRTLLHNASVKRGGGVVSSNQEASTSGRDLSSGRMNISDRAANCNNNLAANNELNAMAKARRHTVMPALYRGVL